MHPVAIEEFQRATDALSAGELRFEDGTTIPGDTTAKPSAEATALLGNFAAAVGDLRVAGVTGRGAYPAFVAWIRAATKLGAYIKNREDEMESAWGIIANVDFGDWRQRKEWVDAASAWRDRYHGDTPPREIALKP